MTRFSIAVFLPAACSCPLLLLSNPAAHVLNWCLFHSLVLRFYAFVPPNATNTFQRLTLVRIDLAQELLLCTSQSVGRLQLLPVLLMSCRNWRETRSRLLELQRFSSCHDRDVRATTTRLSNFFPFPITQRSGCTSLSLINVPETHTQEDSDQGLAIDNYHGVMSASCRQQNSSILRWFKRHKDTAAVRATLNLRQRHRPRSHVDV